MAKTKIHVSLMFKVLKEFGEGMESLTHGNHVLWAINKLQLANEIPEFCTAHKGGILKGT